ncbi:MAG: FecCD family ABC transporter permease [Thermodesulfobacteriota bacterium]
MHSTQRTCSWLVLGLTVAVFAAIVVSTGLGFIRITPVEVVRVIAGRLTGDATLVAGLDPIFPQVVLEVRLPRILAAVGVGAGLAVCGVLFQGILLNPLADPYTLGISSGAAFGASVALLVNHTLLGHLSVPLFAFAGAMAALVVVLLLASHDGQLSANALILAGVIVGAILAAGISFMKYLADEQVGMIVFWLMGSFSGRTWPQVGVVFATLLAGLGVAVYYGRDLNIIALGSRISDSLGVETGRVRRILLVTASLLVAVCVSVSGIIGFIGLIVPHLMRMVVGPDNRHLVVVAALTGGLLLLAADTVTRAVLPSEVPIGVLTALIGGPFFCYIFRRRGAFHG